MLSHLNIKGPYTLTLQGVPCPVCVCVCVRVCVCACACACVRDMFRCYVWVYCFAVLKVTRVATTPEIHELFLVLNQKHCEADHCVHVLCCDDSAVMDQASDCMETKL